MSLSDPIADMLTRIRNGLAANKLKVDMPSSTLKLKVANVLRREGYIESYASKQTENNKAVLSVALKYYRGKPVIDKIQRVSKPGLRIYRGKDDLPRILGGLGVAIISTSAGVMSDKEARKIGCGGEVLCSVS